MYVCIYLPVCLSIYLYIHIYTYIRNHDCGYVPHPRALWQGYGQAAGAPDYSAEWAEYYRQNNPNISQNRIIECKSIEGYTEIYNARFEELILLLKRRAASLNLAKGLKIIECVKKLAAQHQAFIGDFRDSFRAAVR